MTDSSAFRPGDRLGRYRIERRLGSGAARGAYAALDEDVDRPVAIELLSPESFDALVDTKSARASVEHIGIPRLYEIDRTEHAAFGVTELIEGRAVEQMIASEHGISVHVVATIVRAVACSLDAIHRAGIAHGAVKPSNIILERLTGRIVLVGLGRGTAHQDIHALGATALEMLTGKPLDAARTSWDALARHGWRMERAIVGALHEDPAKRTSSAGAFADDVARALPQRRAPLRVLLVDDDPDHLEYFSEALQRRLSGSAIEAAPDGEIGYRAAAVSAPDVAVVDLDMPHMNGLDLITALRETPRLERLPIVVLSGEITDHDRARLTQLGVNVCLEKPTPCWRLADTLREVLGLSPKAASGTYPRVEG